MQGKCHHRFAASGWRVEYDMMPIKKFQNRLFLSWIEFHSGFLHQVHETLEQSFTTCLGNILDMLSNPMRVCHGDQHAAVNKLCTAQNGQVAKVAM